MLRVLYLIPLLFITGPVAADVIFLRNQKYIMGVVRGQDLKHVLIRTEAGRVLRIPKKNIRKILYIPAERMRELKTAAKRRAGVRAKNRRIALKKRQKEQERLAREVTRREAERKKKEAEQSRRDQVEARKLVQKEEESRRIAEREDRSALWRSAVLPGWGQRWKGEYFRGWLFLGAGILTGAALTGDVVAHRGARNEYDEAVIVSLLGLSNPTIAFLGLDMAQDARGGIRRHGNRARSLSALLLAGYIYNLFDAYLLSTPGPSRLGWSLDLPAMQGGSLRFAYTMPLP